jgi:hypothetical protein
MGKKLKQPSATKLVIKSSRQDLGGEGGKLQQPPLAFGKSRKKCKQCCGYVNISFGSADPSLGPLILNYGSGFGRPITFEFFSEKFLHIFDEQ